MVKDRKKIKVAIIGSGLARLTAAYKLTQYGLAVDVFEAKNRVGGRVFTVLMENYLGKVTEVELGGQNITDGGEAANLLSLAKELGLSIQEKVVDLKQWVYSEGRSEYYDQLLAGHHKHPTVIRELAEKADNIGKLIELFCEDNMLLQQALFSRMMAYEGLNPYRQSIYHNIDTLECTLSGGVAKVHEFYEHKPDQVMTSSIQGGNARLPLEISKHLEGRIHYNKALCKIEISHEGAALTFKDQSVYAYDYVIVAIPASTFHNIDFSSAQIEKDRLRKIESIGYGSNYKIALPLDLKKKNDIRLVATSHAVIFYNHDETIQLLYINDEIPDIQAFINVLSKSYDYPVGSYSGEIVKAGDQNDQIYKQNIYYNWKNDPYFQGSYSGYSTSISEELDKIEHYLGTPYKALFTPVNNVLFFAGEHTTVLECIGTMEAAVESGKRVATAVDALAL